MRCGVFVRTCSIWQPLGTFPRRLSRALSSLPELDGPFPLICIDPVYHQRMAKERSICEERASAASMPYPHARDDFRPTLWRFEFHPQQMIRSQRFTTFKPPQQARCYQSGVLDVSYGFALAAPHCAAPCRPKATRSHPANHSPHLTVPIVLSDGIA